jgi:hypothetical protein
MGSRTVFVCDWCAVEEVGTGEKGACFPDTWLLARVQIYAPNTSELLCSECARAHVAGLEEVKRKRSRARP